MLEIKKLRKILYKKEYDTILEENSFKKYPSTKLSYTIDKIDIEYIKYFKEKFNNLDTDTKEKILEREKSDNYKIYRISKNGKEYIGSTSSTLFFFYRYNIYLRLSNKNSVFDLIDENPLGSTITLLEIVRPKKGTRKLVNVRKEQYKTNKLKKKVPKLIDIYESIYENISCGGFGDKQKRYIYYAESDNKSFLFMTNKKIRLLDNIKDKIKKKLKTKKKDDIKIKLIKKTKIRNILEENIMKDKYRILYKPSINNKFVLSELENFTQPITDDKIKELKKKIFLRINKHKFINRIKKHKTEEDTYIYMLCNKINGNGVIKHSNKEPEIVIKNMYDTALKGSKSTLSKDLSMFDQKVFKFKILRILKKKDNLNIVLERFKSKFNLSGYSLNMRQIYSIINAKKN